MTEEKKIYASPFTAYLMDNTFTKTEIRDGIIEEANSLAFELKIDSLEELMKLIPTHVPRLIPLRYLVTKKEFQEILLEVQQFRLEEEERKEREERKKLTPSEKKTYAKLYKKCGGKDPRSM